MICGVNVTGFAAFHSKLDMGYSPLDAELEFEIMT